MFLHEASCASVKTPKNNTPVAAFLAILINLISVSFGPGLVQESSFGATSEVFEKQWEI